MKSTVLVLAGAAALSPAATSAQIQFEGRVTGTMGADGIEVEMVQHMKGSMMRLDVSLPDGGGTMSQITDVESGKMLMIVHEQKMWMDIAMMSQMMPGVAAQAASTQEIELPEFRRTERVETIAGYECRHYILVLDGGDGEVDVCAAPDLGCFIPGAPAGLGRGESKAIPALPQSAELWIQEFGDGFFILSMNAGDASYVVSEVEQGSPPDELFTPPADYTEMKMPGR